ncbi:hypothetical protein CDLVIII_4557 [Clostridium sp. DL-VIII]|uniref:hypothetical protein n=1 Tax=Clostridium sp. DL-VIII TaxID=641107 RepID=UPI00023B07AC|nr:hypothetical protein [Clostridium sp. DL-VIII]EHJ01065.1 hypothetical protein CDLVIII_4557 [Clostridium sp. DL-VIII]
MVTEVVITGIIILAVAHILYHRSKKNMSGGCCCGKGSKNKKKLSEIGKEK